MEESKGIEPHDILFNLNSEFAKANPGLKEPPEDLRGALELYQYMMQNFAQIAGPIALNLNHMVSGPDSPISREDALGLAYYNGISQVAHGDNALLRDLLPDGSMHSETPEESFQRIQKTHIKKPFPTDAGDKSSKDASPFSYEASTQEGVKYNGWNGLVLDAMRTFPSGKRIPYDELTQLVIQETERLGFIAPSPNVVYSAIKKLEKTLFGWSNEKEAVETSKAEKGRANVVYYAFNINTEESESPLDESSL